MATRKQIEANRLNARKSTGPRTPEGKRRSSQNALRTGVDAKAQVIHYEQEADLRRLQSEYYNRFHPTTPEQRMLVDTLIDCEWLLRRFRTCEAEIFVEANPDLSYTSTGKAYLKMAEPLARLQRRIDATQRNFRHALHELERLQSEEEEALANEEQQTENPEIGFDPRAAENHPECFTLPARPSQNEPDSAPLKSPLTQRTS
jgi:hypothetical protein